MSLKLVRSIDGFDNTQPAVIAVGKFDGMHSGHQQIFARMQELQKDGLKSVVFSLFPPPEVILNPQADPEFITTIRQRISLIEKYGVDVYFLKRFTKSFSEISAEDFINHFLIKQLNVQHLLIGADAAFGHNRRGNAEMIKQLFIKAGRTVEQLPTTLYNGSRVGTYWLRSAMHAGDVSTFRALAGRNFSMDSIVVHGDGRGREIGFPTANLENCGQIMPANGIYATRVKLKDQVFDSVTSVGVRPTFDNGRKVVEVHILDFNQDLYGQRLELEFIQYLRAELKYRDIQSLCRQIEVDIENARKILKSK